MFCRVPDRRHTAKKPFADRPCAVRGLPCTAHGVSFAVCLRHFAVCPKHTAKHANPVVHVPALLKGPRCYVDTSIDPYSNDLTLCSVGLGVFLLRFQEYRSQAI